MVDPYPRGMTDTLDPNTSSPSTTWAWKLIKIKPSHPEGRRARSASTYAPNRRRDVSKPLDIKVRYNGGPESSWVIWTRGGCRRFPGHMRIDDVFTLLSEPRLGLGWSGQD